MPAEQGNSVINLVVTCSNRKHAAIHADLLARNLKGRSIDVRLKSWACKLLKRNVDAVPALQVYRGDHWSVVRSIQSPNSRVHINIWIASAGYGLISTQTKIV